MIVTTPAQCIKPPCQTESGRPVVRKFGETIALTDDGNMPFPLTSKVKIACERGRGLSQIFGIYETLRDLGENALATYGANRDPECHSREIEAPIKR